MAEIQQGWFFESKIVICPEMPSMANGSPDKFTPSNIKNETMLFNCNPEFAFETGGPITKAVLNALPYSYCRPDCVVDTRVHMLMLGFYPCIPGWHHDDIPRTREDGQPNYDDPDRKTEHAMFLCGDADAPTDFALGTCFMQDVPIGNVIYRDWHPIIEKKCENGMLKRLSAPYNRLIYFDWQTWHQGVVSKNSGWRYFFRVTRNTKRKATNEIRRQVQVYMPNPMQGW